MTNLELELQKAQTKNIKLLDNIGLVSRKNAEQKKLIEHQQETIDKLNSENLLSLEAKKSYQKFDSDMWQKFRNTGLFLLVNHFLHIFGWSITLEIQQETNEILDVYPNRTTYRGFTQSSETDAYKKIAKYMAENGQEIYNEIK